MAITTNLLYIGQKGLFTFLAPFNTAYNLDYDILTVDSLKSIGELIAGNIDIYSVYFQANGLTTTQYQQFLTSNGIIVTLFDSEGNRYAVPSTFIQGLPNTNGVPYRALGLNVVLGPLPVDYPVSALVDDLQPIISQLVGIQAAITPVQLSRVKLLPNTQATQLENTRVANISGLNTLGYYINQLSIAQTQIQALEQYIVNAQSPSASAEVLLNTGLTLTDGEDYSFDVREITETISPYASSIVSQNPFLPDSVGVFGGGITKTSPIDFTLVYDYATNIVIGGGNLTYNMVTGAAIANSTIGIFGGGSTSNNNALSTTSIYTLETNVAATGSNLATPSTGVAAIGNSTAGVFGGGYYGKYLSVTSIYTYSTSNFATGNNLTYISGYLAAAGNSTIGVFGAGYSSSFGNSSATSIYTYSTGDTVTGSNLSILASNLMATGNSTVGIFGGGSTVDAFATNVTTLYHYNANSSTSGATLSVGVAYGAAISNSSVGIFGGGSTTNTSIISTTSVYNYVTGNFYNGGNLSIATKQMAGASANPGVNY